MTTPLPIASWSHGCWPAPHGAAEASWEGQTPSGFWCGNSGNQVEELPRPGFESCLSHLLSGGMTSPLCLSLSRVK